MRTPVIFFCSFLAAVLSNPLSAAAEDWELFAKGTSTTVYFDRASVNESGWYVEYRVRVEYQKDRETRDKKHRYRKAVTRYAAQCDSEKVALTSVILFDEAGQQVSASSRAPERWHDSLREVRADGIQERLLKHACAIARGDNPPPPDPNAMARRGTTRVGAGIVTTRDGLIVTNHHVVNECSVINIVDSQRSRFTAKLVASDPENDLALIRANTTFDETAMFRMGTTVEAGESVTVVGFPLASILGSSEPNVSFGYVSATAGVRGDRSRFQISAPVHKGNSGGPILDQSGNVIGIVSAKLNALAVQKKTGDLPQNISFGVKATVARAFLDSNNVKYRDSVKRDKLENTEVAAIGKAATVLVSCRKPASPEGKQR